MPRAFVSYMESVLTETADGTETVKALRLARISCVFPFTERVFYGIASRSDQAQTPINLTKLDADKRQSAHHRIIRAAALTDLGKPVADHDRMTIRAGRHVAVPQRVPQPATLILEHRQPVTEPLHHGDGRSAGMMSDQCTQAASSTCPEQIVRTVERVRPRVDELRGVADVVQPGRGNQQLLLLVRQHPSHLLCAAGDARGV